MPDIIDGIAGLISTVVTRIFPDKTVQIQAQSQLQELKENGELQQMLANTNIINQRLALAQKGYWYPAIGWICTLALAINLLVRPFVPEIPPLDMNTIYAIVFPMLGLTAHAYVTRPR